jgi:hypothetical protein
MLSRTSIFSLLITFTAATDWPFALSVSRYKSKDCGEYLSMEGAKGGVHIKQGHFQTWTDGQNFPSFTYSWEKYTSHQHMRSDRDCAVLVYEKDFCEGYLLFVNDFVSSILSHRSVGGDF